MNEEMMKAFSLEGEVAVVTGGGSGLGLSFAKCLAAAGAKVAIIGTRSQELLDEACREIGNGAKGYQFDITDIAHSADIVEKITADFGKIDILVNNAGFHVKKWLKDLSMEEFQKIVNVHLTASVALTKAVLPQMEERRHGNVIFISSMSAYMGMTQVLAYSAAKTGILGVVRSLAGEYSDKGIRINAIAPGFIKTAIFEKAVATDPERQHKILGHTPMARYGLPIDCAWPLVFLCTPAAGFITGTCIPVDGGCNIGF